MGEAARKFTFNETTIEDVDIIDVPIPARGLRVGPAKSILKRVLAQVIDELIISTIAVPLFFVQLFLYPLLLVGLGVPQTDTVVLVENIFASLVSLAFVISYYYFQYRYKCTTIGRRIFDYRIYKYQTSEPIGIFKIINRDIIGKTLSIILFPISIFLFYRNQDCRFLHDYMARTQMIKEDPEKVPID